MASAALSLTGSATPSSPAGRPSTATNITVWPSCRISSARAGRSPRSIPSSSISARLPSATWRPSTVPFTPLPVTDSNSDARRGRPALLRAADDRRGQRVLAARSRLAARRRNPFRSNRPPFGNEPGLALGQRAGLVHDQGVHLAQNLDGLGIAEQHARASSLAGRHHDRHRRREAQGTGAGDDEHRDRVDERIGEAGAGPRPPDDEGHDRHHDDDRDEPGGDPIGQPLDGGAAALRLAHHATICASSVSAPTRSARITSPPCR